MTDVRFACNELGEEPPSTETRMLMRRHFFILLGAGALLGLTAGARAQQPATSPRVERAQELARLAIAADSAPMHRFVEERFSPEFMRIAPMPEHLTALFQIGGRLVGRELRSVSEATPGEVVLLYYHPATEEFSRFRVLVDTAAPYRVREVGPPQPGGGPPGAGAAAAGDEEAMRQLHAYAGRLAAAELYSGTLLVARGDRVLHEQAYGLASREYGVPNRPDTRYNLGSINKMFTAVAILRLVESGRLSLQDPVEKHLPGVLDPEVARKVRIEHLLTHTSGLGDFLFTPEMMPLNRASFRRVADFLPHLANDRLAFEPGTRWAYSNTGFLVLGAILERVTGEEYQAHVRRTIFQPLGMPNTDSYARDAVVQGLASNYELTGSPAGRGWRNVTFDVPVRGTPAGGGYSTARDLYTFMRALTGGQLLSPRMTEAMLTPKPALGSPAYGYGIQLLSPSGNIIGHTGGGPGVSDFVAVHRPSGTFTVALSNLAGETGALVRRGQTLLGHREQPPAPAAGGAAAPPQGERPPFLAAVESLIEAIADPSAARVRAFADAHMTPAYRDSKPVEQHVRQLEEMRAVLGRPELVDLILVSPTERRAVLRSSVNGERYPVLFTVSSDMPPKIAGMSLQTGGGSQP
jgi:CubicO group peptidase (beta-lactamase class C family)